MPQNQNAISALREIGRSSGPSAEDLRGLNPELMLQAMEQYRRRKSSAADIAKALGQQQTREARTGIQRERLELEKAKAELDAILDKKKYEMEKKLADARSEYMEAQTDELKKKVDRYDIKTQAIDKMRNLQIPTSLGEMSALKAMIMKERGFPIEGPGEFQYEIVDANGNRNLLRFRGLSGDYKMEKLGKIPESEQDKKTLAEKIEDAGDEIDNMYGKSDLSGLDPDIGFDVSATKALGNALLINEEEKFGNEAGRRAWSQTKNYLMQLSKIPEQSRWGSNSEKVKKTLTNRVMPKFVDAISKMNRAGIELPHQYTKSYLVNYLRNKGYSDKTLGLTEETGRDIVEQAMEDYLNASEQ